MMDIPEFIDWYVERYGYGPSLVEIAARQDIAHNAMPARWKKVLDAGRPHLAATRMHIEALVEANALWIAADGKYRSLRTVAPAPDRKGAGGPHPVTEIQQATISEAWEAGLSMTAIATLTGLQRSKVEQIVQEHFRVRLAAS